MLHPPDPSYVLLTSLLRLSRLLLTSTHHPFIPRLSQQPLTYPSALRPSHLLLTSILHPSWLLLTTTTAS